MLRRICCLVTLLVAIPVTSRAAIPKKVNEKEMVSCIIVAEAGGEGKIGMIAVYEVILTRAKQKNISQYKVVTEKAAFSCFNRYRNNPQAFINKWKKHKLYNVAVQIVTTHTTTNITKNSNFFHERTVKPEWSRGIKPTIVIGKHLFFALAY